MCRRGFALIVRNNDTGCDEFASTYAVNAPDLCMRRRGVIVYPFRPAHTGAISPALRQAVLVRGSRRAHHVGMWPWLHRKHAMRVLVPVRPTSGRRHGCGVGSAAPLSGRR